VSGERERERDHFIHAYLTNSLLYVVLTMNPPRYFVESGTYQVTIDLKKVRECVCGDIFGELALIYNAKRSATITCLDKGKLWMLDRKTLRLTLLGEHACMVLLL
jgi:CRP-like cAMP-binding protein